MSNQLRRLDRSGGLFPSLLNRWWNDDFFDNFFEGDRLPATNIKENKKEFKLELSVPGFDKDDFKIEIDKNVLKISAHKEVRNEEKDEDDKVLRQEFRQSSFVRSFTIPENIDRENIEAKQKDGILEVVLPKMDKAIEDKIKKIEIK
ncbi:MAG TPA: hypothetical protein DIT04_08925 [Dysgonomonas sp.]|nr:hypothetical protein [Dysgonomonas sp.]